MSLKRQDIIDSLTTQLKAINGTGGYHLNFSASVFNWRTTDVAANEMPAAIIRDTGRAPIGEGTRQTANNQDHYLSVEIDIVVATEAQARQAIQDILKAIDADYTLGGFAIDVLDDGDEIYSDHQGQRVFSPVLKLRIMYRTMHFREN